MKEEDRIKLKIEKLKGQSDYHKWEVNQYDLLFVGMITLLIVIYIPTMIALKSISLIIILGVILIVLLVTFYYFIRPLTKKSFKKIEDYSKQINRLYEELGV